ncbi:MAG: chemotaxis protein CheW [Candidatus Riflebacteria bacterium]|nr:chemotaxis protein CheW [Candidatus Riflebacteria bacterium]
MSSKLVDEIEKKLICSFRIADRLFGFDIRLVKEIITEFQITPVFHAPEPVKGFMNLRGQIHLILDLRMVLGFERKLGFQPKFIIIFKPSVSEPFGVLVEKIEDIVEISDEMVERSSFTRSPDDRILGVCKLSSGLLILLNPLSILKEVSMDTWKIDHRLEEVKNENRN